MLVSIFNTTDRSGGAGIAAFRLARALETQGVSSPLLCLHRKFNDANTFRYEVRRSELSPSLSLHREAVARVQKRYINSNRSSVSRTIYSSPWASGHLVADNPVIRHSRILHFHWINHFLDIQSIAELGRLGIPLVWTLHDEWLYTAGCHYTTGCTQYLSHCSNCPQLLRDPYELVEYWFAQKSELIDQLNLTVVTPSEWLGDRARRSRLLRNKDVQVVRNPFDTTTFRPLPRQRRTELRQARGFADHTIVLAFGAQSLADKRKGFGLLVEALTRLAASTEVFDRSDVGLLIFGGRSDELDKLAGRVRVSFVGELHVEEEISEVLSVSDCFIVPSLEENYPNVIIESLLSGTPVIAFSCGGIPEQIGDGENGLLVDPVGSAHALARAIQRLLTDHSLRTRLRRFDRQALVANHSLATIGYNTVGLYTNLNPNFLDPVDTRIAEYLSHKAAMRGPARSFQALPSYASIGNGLAASQLLRDEVAELHRQERETTMHAQHRLYLGFLDATHDFGRSGTASRFLNFGWSSPEASGVWSCERTAGLVFFLPKEMRGPLRLVATARCQGTSQVTILRIGNQEVGRIKVSSKLETHRLSLAIPPFVASGGLVQVHFDFPHAQPEKASSRLLGIFLSKLATDCSDPTSQDLSP